MRWDLGFRDFSLFSQRARTDNTYPLQKDPGHRHHLTCQPSQSEIVVHETAQKTHFHTRRDKLNIMGESCSNFKQIFFFFFFRHSKSHFGFRHSIYSWFSALICPTPTAVWGTTSSSSFSFRFGRTLQTTCSNFVTNWTLTDKFIPGMING